MQETKNAANDKTHVDLTDETEFNDVDRQKSAQMAAMCRNVRREADDCCIIEFFSGNWTSCHCFFLSLHVTEMSGGLFLVWQQNSCSSASLSFCKNVNQLSMHMILSDVVQALQTANTSKWSRTQQQE